jgi:hypothetical protein
MKNSGKLSLDWVKGLGDKQKEHLQKDLPAILLHNEGFKRLREILEQDKQRILSEEITRSNYDNPNWAYLQAHYNGQIKQIDRLLKLLTTHKET